MENETNETVVLINTLFDQIKTKHQLASDSALARHIGVNDMAIWRWRRGEFGVSMRVIGPLLVDYAESIRPVEIAS